MVGFKERKEENKRRQEKIKEQLAYRRKMESISAVRRQKEIDAEVELSNPLEESIAKLNTEYWHICKEEDERKEKEEKARLIAEDAKKKGAIPYDVSTVAIALTHTGGEQWAVRRERIDDAGLDALIDKAQGFGQDYYRDEDDFVDSPEGALDEYRRAEPVMDVLRVALERTRTELRKYQRAEGKANETA